MFSLSLSRFKKGGASNLVTFQFHIYFQKYYCEFFIRLTTDLFNKDYQINMLPFLNLLI